MKIIRLALIFFILGFIYLSQSNKSFALETGFLPPTSCSTNGSSCSAMNLQDANYNSWTSNINEEVVVSLTSFDVPTSAVIDDIQVKMRIRTSTFGWTWFVRASIDNGVIYFPPLNCTIFVTDLCRYNTFASFNSIAFPTITFLNNNPSHILLGNDVISPNFKLRLHQNSGVKNTDIDVLLFNIRYHFPSVSTPTPTPSGPAPFLDLPWDYEGKGMTFSEAALSMSSYFDHEYPLLSSGLGEGGGSGTIKKYDGSPRSDDSYSSHDGYDYARSARVLIGDPVLAAADGMATYVKSCNPCGNMIVIDHGNGYQTRYLHMQEDGLIISTPNTPVLVNGRQIIGKVGATGNVSPPGDAGAHIHFGIFQDKNHDGNFGDNIPDGATDPFGWQSKDPDPWEMYSFLYGGVQRTGNKSHYLWKVNLESHQSQLSTAGGTIKSTNKTIIFPQGVTSQPLNLIIESEPIVDISATLSSIGTSFELTAINSIGTTINQFLKPFIIQIDFSSADIERFDPNTISLYSSQDRINWVKEVTNVDLTNRISTSTLDHLTHFALIGERKDIIPPFTEANFVGDMGKEDWYKSNVEIDLTASDNENGLGVDYTIYKLDDANWEQYTSPISVTSEGYHTIRFYSADNDENLEDIKTQIFGIDKTQPEIKHITTSDGNIYNFNNWVNTDVIVTFLCIDDLSGVDTITPPIHLSQDGQNQTATGKCQDKAGNDANLLVGSINIDKTPPIIIINASPSVLWPPNGKMMEVNITGEVRDISSVSTTFVIDDEYELITPQITDFYQIVELEAKRNGSDLDGRVYIIKVSAVDQAGNTSYKEVEINVPHD